MTEAHSTAAASNHIFYITFAHVVEVWGPTRCNLWVVDHAEEAKVDHWLDKLTTNFPPGMIIDVDFDNTLDNRKARKVDVAPRRIGNLNLTTMGGDYPLGGEICGQIAISAELWNSLPHKPVGLAEEYQLKIIVQSVGHSSRNAYLGFRSWIMDLDPTNTYIKHVRFYSWTGDTLGDAWVNLATKGFYHDRDTQGCLHRDSRIDDKGAVFVSAELIGTKPLDFLIGPKVPYGAGGATPGGKARRATNADHIAFICSNDPDHWLAEAREHIRYYRPATTGKQLENAIVNLLKNHPHRQLNLLSHSYADQDYRHVLRFGKYNLDENAFSNPSAALGNALRGRQIYLIGCYTAYAGHVLRSLENRFNAHVFGTTRVVGLYDLEVGGVKSRRYKNLFARADEVKEDGEFRVVPDHLAEASVDIHEGSAEVREFWEGAPEGPLGHVCGLDLDSLRNAEAYYDIPGVLAIPDFVGRDTTTQVLVELLVQAWLARITIHESGALAKTGVFLLSTDQRKAVQDALAQRNPSVK